MGSVFICIAPKAGTQFNGELTCSIELLCQQLCAMSCYRWSGVITFGQTLSACVVLTVFSSVWPAEKVLCHISWSNPLLKFPKYNVLRHYYQRNTCLYKPSFSFHPDTLTLSSTLFSHLSKFISLYITVLLIFLLWGWKSVIYLLICIIFLCYYC